MSVKKLEPREASLSFDYPGVAFTMPSGGSVIITRCLGIGPTSSLPSVPADWADARELIAGLDRLYFQPHDARDRERTALRREIEAAIAKGLPGTLENARGLLERVSATLLDDQHTEKRLLGALTEKLRRPRAFGEEPRRYTCGQCHSDITVDTEARVRDAVLNARAQSDLRLTGTGDRPAGDATGGQTPPIPLPEGEWGESEEPRVTHNHAPWTQDYIDHLNRRQSNKLFHPFTCGSGNRTDAAHLDGEGVLIATKWGWMCPFCPYRQAWAVREVNHSGSGGGGGRCELPNTSEPQPSKNKRGGLFFEAKRLLGLMDEVPVDQQYPSHTDRVFARFEFDGLRFAIETEEKARREGDSVARCCEACGVRGKVSPLVGISTTNGNLWICNICMDDLAARIAEIKAARRGEKKGKIGRAADAVEAEWFRRLCDGLAVALELEDGWPDKDGDFVDLVLGMVKGRLLANHHNILAFDREASQVLDDFDNLIETHHALGRMMKEKHVHRPLSEMFDSILEQLVLCWESQCKRVRKAIKSAVDADKLAEDGADAEDEANPDGDSLASLRQVHGKLLNAVKDTLGYKNWPDISGEFIDGVIGLVKGRLISLENYCMTHEFVAGDGGIFPFVPYTITSHPRPVRMPVERVTPLQERKFNELQHRYKRLLDGLRENVLGLDAWPSEAADEFTGGDDFIDGVIGLINGVLGGIVGDRDRVKRTVVDFIRFVTNDPCDDEKMDYTEGVELWFVDLARQIEKWRDIEAKYGGNLQRTAQAFAPDPEPWPAGRLKQSDVVEMVLEERRYQDERWGSIHERAHEVGAWLTLMRHHVTKAAADWSESSGDVASVHGVRKIAAIAVACLEQHATPDHYRNAVEAKKVKYDSDATKE